LRYAAQLLNPAYQLAKIYKQTSVNTKVIEEASELFYDAKRSAEILKARESEFLK
jgi:DNA helicase TIP49 (TBP-interacting protein)